MSSNKILPIILTALALLTAGCGRKADSKSVSWGRTDTYDPFLWKRQTPDTLKRTLCFDFNDDAQKYMRTPLKLGVFKKDDDGHLRQVQTDEMQLFVNGRPLEGNVITVRSDDREVEVGVVFSPGAENKTHYWYLRPIDSGGLDRINDQDDFGTDGAIMEIKARKRHVMNPLAEAMMWTGILLLAALVLWFVLLKRLFFPVFRVTRLQLTGPEPYQSQLRIKGYRQCVLSARPKRQNALNRLFAGKVRYETNPLWTAPVVIEPRDKKSVRVRPDRSYSTDARLMKTNTDYVIVNETTKTKTTMRIS